jgi:hypothetical protein
MKKLLIYIYLFYHVNQSKASLHNKRTEAIPVRGRENPQGCEMSRLLYFL